MPALLPNAVPLTSETVPTEPALRALTQPSPSSEETAVSPVVPLYIPADSKGATSKAETVVTNPKGLARRRVERKKLTISGPDVCIGREEVLRMTSEQLYEKLGLPDHLLGQTALQRSRGDTDHIETMEVLDRAAIALISIEADSRG